MSDLESRLQKLAAESGDPVATLERAATQLRQARRVSLRESWQQQRVGWIVLILLILIITVRGAPGLIRLAQLLGN